MKSNSYSILLGLLTLGLLDLPSQAQVSVAGSDGSDGVLVVTANRVINLGDAVVGAWDQNNAANAGKGVYDAEKWAVVYKFDSITINEGVDLTFVNHSTRAPVVWLVKSNVTINGRVNLDGKTGTFGAAPFGTEGGPGGFRGNVVGSGGESSGFGPPGGPYWQHRSLYGNPHLIPLMGGSGASTGFSYTGGGGGGAILILAEGKITIGSSGSIVARGGGNNSRDAAGGAIRLVANELVGTGSLNAGPEGRIRLEGNISTQQRYIKTPDTQTYRPGNPVRIWPTADAPTSRIIRVGGVSVTEDPKARIDDDSDVRIETQVAVDIDIETRNFPTSGKVALRIVPKFAPSAEYAAELISGDDRTAIWRVSRVLGTGFSVLQVRAYVPRG